jgi:nucleotide-binding universal stress UspA family protein
MSHAILLAVDGTPASARSVDLLAGYCGESELIDIAVLNVQARPASIWPEAAIDVRSVEDALLAAGREICGAATARLKAARLHADFAVRLGSPAGVILREAQSGAASLIVMGTRGHGAMRGFALGSVAMRVAHGNAVPVCLLHPETALPARLGSSLRVMLALDGSEPALRAARLLAAWRAWLGELDVQIVYVQQPLSYLATVLQPHDGVIAQWSAQAGEAATQAARDLFAREGISHHLHLTAGDAAREIVHLASETKCELMALGTRGLGAAHHALIGSVALKVAAHAAMPVVLVK